MTIRDFLNDQNQRLSTPYIQTRIEENEDILIAIEVLTKSSSTDLDVFKDEIYIGKLSAHTLLQYLFDLYKNERKKRYYSNHTIRHHLTKLRSLHEKLITANGKAKIELADTIIKLLTKILADVT